MVQLIKARRQDPDLHTRTDLLSRYMCMENSTVQLFLSVPVVSSLILVVGLPFVVNHSDEHLRDIVLNFMIAGRDTTAQVASCFFEMASVLCSQRQHWQTLSWLFYNLSRKEEKQKELIKELDTFDSLPDYDELKRLKYTLGVINETLRST